MKLDYFFLKLTHHIASEFPDRIDEKEMIKIEDIFYKELDKELSEVMNV